ncbi:MAG: hypothetical protein K9N07_04415 [Candidatus Cloacimonetes bacterium]|nr:hypothetical protein [Candidatus Cloacimonadota bacterium]
MKKFLKFIFTLASIAGIGYISLKLYQLIKGLIELDKTLPQYLGNIIGDVPKISISSNLNNISITVIYSKEVIEKNENLENIVRDYVTDFYPIFKADKVTVVIEEEQPK